MFNFVLLLIDIFTNLVCILFRMIIYTEMDMCKIAYDRKFFSCSFPYGFKMIDNVGLKQIELE